MLASSSVIAFVSTAEMTRASHFDGAILGLPLIDEGVYASVFDAGGAQLRVTAVDTVSPQPYTVLGWSVADIATIVRALASAGVRLLRYPGMEQDELGVWLSPSGARVAWFEDPDRNVLSLTQF
jgi:catechol 2,3-dioxygenase-like lactoylglutathione lyase family enzyme